MGKPRHVLKAVEIGGQHNCDEHEVTRAEVKQVKESLSQLEDAMEKKNAELNEIDWSSWTRRARLGEGR
jgi:hypothetical protein